MSIHENIKRMKAEQRKQLHDDDYEEKGISDLQGAIAGGLSNVFNTDVSYEKRDYLKNIFGWVFACVTAIADECAGIEIYLKQFKNDDVTVVDDHEVLDLIYRANNVTTKYDLIKLTFQFLEQTGEAPWFLEFKNGKPVSIILLRPDRLTVLPGKGDELVGGYKYRVEGTGGYKEITLEPFEVIPLRYIDPSNPFRGRGPLQAAQQTTEIDEYAEGWNKKFFRNSANPGAALETEKILSTDARAKLARQIKEQHTGYENSQKTLILESGIKWKPLAISQKDMDFVAQQTFSRDKILAIFRVPPTVLGLTADVTRANAEATDYVFAKRTIKPKMQGLIEQLNEFLVPLFDDTGTLYLDFADPVPENIAEKMLLAGGVQQGWMTVNEGREIFNLEPVDGGDELRDPLSFSPVLNSVNKPISSKKKEKKMTITTGQKSALMARTRHQRNFEKKKEKIINTLAEKLVPVLYESMKKEHDIKKLARDKKIHDKNVKKLKELWTGTDDEVKAKKIDFQSEQLRLGEKYEADVIKAAQVIFEKQKKTVLAKIERGDKEAELNLKDQIESYTEKLEPLLLDVIQEQSKRAFRLVGQDNELTKAFKKQRNGAVAEYLKFYLFDLAKDITEYTNDLLGKTLSEGVENEESIPKLKDRVEALFEGMEGYRAERIARTEVIRATNFATEEAYKVSGVVEGKEWLTFLDSDTDDDCASLDGEVAQLGESFPGGVQYPPIHPNCRCTLVPVVV